MNKYTIVYKDIGDNKIRCIDNLDTYELLFKLNKLQEFFDDFITVGEDLFFVEYKGYIWDCTDIDRIIDYYKKQTDEKPISIIREVEI